MGVNSDKYKINQVTDINISKEEDSIRIMLISDTHTMHESLDLTNLKDVDICLHAGDFTFSGKEEEVKSFIEWYKKLNVKYKIYIAGNHELTLDLNHKKGKKEIKDIVLNEKDLIYLENNSVNIMGLNIFGSPYSPEFCNWGFPTPSDADELYKKIISEDTDIILIHGPPYNILDKTVDGLLTGCKYLLNRIKQVKPGIVVFGHIHESYGIVNKNNTIFVNASNVNFNYKMVNKPLLFDINKKKK